MLSTLSGAISPLFGMWGGPCRRRAREVAHVISEEHCQARIALEATHAGHEEQLGQEACEPAVASQRSRRPRRQQRRQQKRQQKLELLRNESCEALDASNEDASPCQDHAHAELRLSEVDSSCSLVETPTCNNTSDRIGRLHTAAGSAASRSTSASGQSSPGPSSEGEGLMSDADSSRVGREQVRGLPDFDYPVLPVFEKNTFLHADVGRSDSLDDFFFERLTRSCPGSRLGSTCDEPPAAETQEAEPVVATEMPTESLQEMAPATAALQNAAAPAAEIVCPAVDLPNWMIPSWDVANLQEDLVAHHQNLAYEPVLEAAHQLLQVPLRCNVPPPPQEAPVLKISLLDSLELPPLMQDNTMPMVAQQHRPPPAASKVDALWTEGGRGHGNGACKPCAHFHSGRGCVTGVECRFCHFCPPGELKRRQKARRQALRDQFSVDA